MTAKTEGDLGDRPQRDYLCMIRYAIYGAILGALAGSIYDDQAVVVYGAAAAGAVIFLMLKLFVVDSKPRRQAG